MKLKDYIEKLQKIMNDAPGGKDLTVIYSSDDEGNSFSEVHFDPTLGKFEDNEFEAAPLGDDSPNCVCVN